MHTNLGLKAGGIRMEVNVTLSPGPPTPHSIPYAEKKHLEASGHPGPSPSWQLSSPRSKTLRVGSRAKSLTLLIGALRSREGKKLTQSSTATCEHSWDQILHLMTQGLPHTAPHESSQHTCPGGGDIRSVATGEGKRSLALSRAELEAL